MNITLQSKERKVHAQAPVGELLSEVCMEEEFFLNMHCGGGGTCGHCMVSLVKGSFLCGDKEVHVGEKPVRALACKTKVMDAQSEIYIPSLSLIELSGKIADDFLVESFHEDSQTKKYFLSIPEATLEHNLCEKELIEKELSKDSDLQNFYFPLGVLQHIPYSLREGKRKITVTLGRIRNAWFVINIQPGDSTKHHLAVAIDIGTTTTVGVIVDLYESKILGRVSRYNQQIKVADDVASRISYCTTPAKVAKLQKLIVDETINPILKELCFDSGFASEEISRVAVCGNTVMTHLFLGMNPESIGKIPFNPVTKYPGEFSAKDIGLAILENAIVDLIPSIAGYVGGDITADIYVAKMHTRKGLSLLVDIGTNGEMAVSYNGDIKVCATPAGPAFEGAGLYQGCRASYGSIEKVEISDTLDFRIGIIGDTKAKGICGSAIIDFIAQARKAGLLNLQGRFDRPQLKSLGLYTTVSFCDKEIHACILVPEDKSGIDGPIVVTEEDISKILQAKAAIYSGIKTLLAVAGHSIDKVDRFILAGGFAAHIDLDNAKILGLIPEVESSKIEVIGNGSLAGAFLSLVEADALEAFKEISSKPEMVELNLVPDFQNNFVEALMIPHLEEDDFPLTTALLDR